MNFYILVAICVASGVPWSSQDKKQTVEAPVLSVQTGHVDSFASAAFSPNGQVVATTPQATDNSVVLWEVRSGFEIRRLEGHTKAPSSASFSPDGRFVVTAGWDKTLRLWEAATGKQVWVGSEHSSNVNTARFSPDGKRIVSASHDGTIGVWEVASGKLSSPWRYLPARHEGEVKAACFSPDGLRIASAGADGAVRIWDSLAGRPLGVLKHPKAVHSVEYSADGRHLVTAGDDPKVRIWNTATGKEMRSLAHNGPVEGAAISTDGKRVATACGNRVTIWDAESGEPLHKLDCGAGFIFSVAFSSDGARIVSAHGKSRTANTGANAARIWETETGKTLGTLQGIGSQAMHASYSPAGTHLATALYDATARIWDLESGREAQILRGHTKFLQQVRFTPDGKDLLTVAWDQTVRKWDLESGAEKLRIDPRKIYDASELLTGPTTFLALSRDAKLLATGCALDLELLLFDPSTGRELKRLSHSRTLAEFRDAAFSHDGLKLAAAYDNAVHIIDVETSKTVGVLEGHSNLVTSVVYSPDGRRIATGSGDGTARLWDAATGKQIREYGLSYDAAGKRLTTGHFQPIGGVAFSPDGRRLATASDDRKILIWDVEAGTEILALMGHTDRVSSVSFSKDGAHLVTTSFDKTFRIWEAASGRELCALISLIDGSWAVVAPDGRFDADSLEDVKGLHWVAPDQPFAPVGIEAFMRQYYEPKLLARLLKGERFPAIPNILGLNRVQPIVEIVSVEREADKPTAKVVVQVSGASGEFEGEGSRIVKETGAHDLRVFRDGRLVRHVPGTLVAKGGASRTFALEGVPLPSVAEAVRFKAYCFNDDGVKSANAEASLARVAPDALRKGTVYCLSVGANAYSGGVVGNLRYASADARAMVDMVQQAFAGSTQVAQVVPVLLTSETTGGDFATKPCIQAALDILAGRPPSEAALLAAPQLRALRKSTPDDLVLFTWSGHGISRDGGRFYLVPSDIRSKDTLLQDCVSTDELSDWFRDIDAAEMAFVVDACHSSAAIEEGGFRPGPMGARGLGQLAYDKGMLVLAATQAENVALETAELRHGLLTYALAVEGFKEGKATSRDGSLTLRGLLGFAERRVPELYKRMYGGEGLRSADGRSVTVVGGVLPPPREDLQRPSLFDFLKERRPVMLKLPTKL